MVTAVSRLWPAASVLRGWKGWESVKLRGVLDEGVGEDGDGPMMSVSQSILSFPQELSGRCTYLSSSNENILVRMRLLQVTTDSNVALLVPSVLAEANHYDKLDILTGAVIQLSRTRPRGKFCFTICFRLSVCPSLDIPNSWAHFPRQQLKSSNISCLDVEHQDAAYSRYGSHV